MTSRIFIPTLMTMTNASFGTMPFGKSVLLMSSLNALPVVLNVFAGSFLWFGSDYLAGHMVKRKDTPIEPIVVGQEIQIIAFSSIGISQLLLAIPRIGQIVTNLFILNQQDVFMRYSAQKITFLDVLSVIIQLLLGLWLLLGASGLVRLLRSFRSVGMDK